MWDFFRFKDNEKDKNKNNSRNGYEEKAVDDYHDSLELSNKNQNNIFSISNFPEKITQIDNAYSSLKEKEEIILYQIIESLKEGRQQDSKKFFN